MIYTRIFFSLFLFCFCLCVLILQRLKYFHPCQNVTVLFIIQFCHRPELVILLAHLFQQITWDLLSAALYQVTQSPLTTEARDKCPHTQTQDGPERGYGVHIATTHSQCQTQTIQNPSLRQRPCQKPSLRKIIRGPISM